MDKILAAVTKAVSLETGYCSSLSSYCLYCFGSLYAGGNVWFSLNENAPRLKGHTTFHNAPYGQFITSCDDSSTLQQLAFHITVLGIFKFPTYLIKNTLKRRRSTVIPSALKLRGLEL